MMMRRMVIGGEEVWSRECKERDEFDFSQIASLQYFSWLSLVESSPGWQRSTPGTNHYPISHLSPLPIATWEPKVCDSNMSDVLCILAPAFSVVCCYIRSFVRSTKRLNMCTCVLWLLAVLLLVWRILAFCYSRHYSRLMVNPFKCFTNTYSHGVVWLNSVVLNFRQSQAVSSLTPVSAKLNAS